MKEFTFSIRVIEWNVVDGEDICKEVSIVFLKEELTDEQADRLEQSYASGKYQYMHEDKNLADIYWTICDFARQIIEGEPGHEADMEMIEYPEELFLEKEAK